MDISSISFTFNGTPRRVDHPGLGNTVVLLSCSAGTVSIQGGNGGVTMNFAVGDVVSPPDLGYFYVSSTQAPADIVFAIVKGDYKRTGATQISAPLGQKAAASSVSVTLSADNVADLASILAAVTPPTRPDTAWLPFANYSADQILSLTPPWWAKGINFCLDADSTVAGAPVIEMAIGYESDAAFSRTDMAVYSLAASPNNQAVVLQMGSGIPGTSTAPASITRLGNRTLVQVNAQLPAAVYICFRVPAAGAGSGTFHGRASYSWTA